MKNFLKTVNWKFIVKAEAWCFLFLIVSYTLGNSKFPHHVWAIFAIMIVFGLLLLGEAYSRYTHKEEDGKNNG
ncbi:MAG: hypothetical protein WC428_02830 [Candidatus Paceibacterota bacterium]|jgi:hypothetical protein